MLKGDLASSSREDLITAAAEYYLIAAGLRPIPEGMVGREVARFKERAARELLFEGCKGQAARAAMEALITARRTALGAVTPTEQ